MHSILKLTPSPLCSQLISEAPGPARTLTHELERERLTLASQADRKPNTSILRYNYQAFHKFLPLPHCSPIHWPTRNSYLRKKKMFLVTTNTYTIFQFLATIHIFLFLNYTNKCVFVRQIQMMCLLSIIDLSYQAEIMP